MMQRNSFSVRWLWLVSFLVLASCATEYNPVKTVPDPDTDFSQYRTFDVESVIVEPVDNGQQDLIVSQQVAQALEQNLSQKGLRHMEQGEPDLTVRFMAKVDPQSGVDVEYVPTEQGIWTRYWNDPISRGQLLVNMVDNRSGEVVWKGVITGEMEQKEPLTQAQIDQAVDQLLAEFPPSASQRGAER